MFVVALFRLTFFSTFFAFFFIQFRDNAFRNIKSMVCMTKVSLFSVLVFHIIISNWNHCFAAVWLLLSEFSVVSLMYTNWCKLKTKATYYWICFWNGKYLTNFASWTNIFFEDWLLLQQKAQQTVTIANIVMFSK